MLLAPFQKKKQKQKTKNEWYVSYLKKSKSSEHSSKPTLQGTATSF